MAEGNKATELHGEETGKKKYISDVLDINKMIEEYGNKIMIIAGVGSGKSTWVKEVLTQKGNVLFITSRRAKVDEDIAHSCFTSFVREQDGQRENLITNAKLGYIRWLPIRPLLDPRLMCLRSLSMQQNKAIKLL